MKIELDQDQENEFKAYLCELVKASFDGMHLEPESKPYLNRAGIARWLGVSPNTVDHWVTLGLPVANVDGFKLYGKASVKAWLAQHEQPKQAKQKRLSAGKVEKRPLTVL